MTLMTSREARIRICEALGLDASKVRSLRLDVQPDTMAIVIAERYVSDGELAEIVSELQRFELVPKGEA